jgi:hypothetical protein
MLQIGSVGWSFFPESDEWFGFVVNELVKESHPKAKSPV